MLHILHKATCSWILMLLMTAMPLVYANDQSALYPVAKYSKQNNPLLKVAKQKSTVGIIPYYVINKKIYIFIGQDLSGSKKETSGTFSDFGGTVAPNGQTVLQHALQEFKRDTMGHIQLNADDVLKNGYLLMQKNSSGATSYYIFVKLNEKQYLKTQKFHPATVRLKASSVPNGYLAKDMFIWVQLDPLQKQIATAQNDDVTLPINPTQRFTVQTNNNQTLSILLKANFLQDCLCHGSLANLLQQLSR